MDRSGVQRRSATQEDLCRSRHAASRATASRTHGPLASGSTTSIDPTSREFDSPPEYGPNPNPNKTMVDLLPKHNTDHSPLKRHTSVYTVQVSDDRKEANAVSSFVIYQNILDGENSHADAGESRLFLIGKYYDKLSLDDGKARFKERIVRLDNRRLDKGSHWPL